MGTNECSAQICKASTSVPSSINMQQSRPCDRQGLTVQLTGHCCHSPGSGLQNSCSVPRCLVPETEAELASDPSSHHTTQRQSSPSLGKTLPRRSLIESPLSCAVQADRFQTTSCRPFSTTNWKCSAPGREPVPSGPHSSANACKTRVTEFSSAGVAGGDADFSCSGQ